MIINENSRLIYDANLSVPIDEGKLYDENLDKKINKVSHITILLEPDLRYHKDVFFKDPYIKIYNGEKGDKSRYCCIHLKPDEKEKHKGKYKVDHHPTGNPPRLKMTDRLMDAIIEILDKPSTYKGRTVWEAIVHEMTMFYIGETINLEKPNFKDNWYENK